MTQTVKQQVSGIDVTIEYANEGDAPVSEKEIGAYISRAREPVSYTHLDVYKRQHGWFPIAEPHTSRILPPEKAVLISITETP